MNQRKPTDEELLAALDEQDAADEAERILALSDEALDAELKREGLDPVVEREHGRTLGTGGVRRGASGSGSAPRRLVTATRWVSLLAAALAVAAVSVVVIVPAVRRWSHRGQYDITADTDWTFAPSAKQVRRDALRACDDERWSECVAGLDAARKLDPPGDSDERVQQARATASAALAPPLVETGHRQDKPRPDDKPRLDDKPRPDDKPRRP
jgi:hypothetical protein